MIECSRCGRQVVMAVGRCSDCGADLAALVEDDPQRRTVVERGPGANAGQVSARKDDAGDSALRRTVVDGAKRPGLDLDLARLRQILTQAGASKADDEEDESDIRQIVRELPPTAAEEFAPAQPGDEASCHALSGMMRALYATVADTSLEQ